ncbi:DUF4097 family beta strand repeat-containing protein [Halobacillus halophilus]|uniref:DUF4097 family beta strand repeat-containing protein n=1 Tax=Halobacillus halophilus TaxID=1570 RepID=UPI001CD273A9|nr:DUF4097 family beta strand repeat-containing protein [Halobacillus halophilus]MCA1011211.1 DUF4097 family beta strand repeat-containing protein [Halobacillus halophilus]
MNEERMKILKMIEEGNVSAEEGAKLLAAVENREAGESKADEREKKKYGIKSFLGDAVEKIKNTDFDLSFGEYVEFNYETQTESDNFNDIDVSIANGSLDVDTWEGHYAKAAYHVRVYQVDSEEEARRHFLADGQFDIHNGLLRLASPSKKIKTFVHLSLPKKKYDFIKSKLANGTITFNHMDSDYYQLKTSNGRIQLNSVSGETCKVETGNGAITVADGVFDTCEMDTLNGAVTLGGDFGKSDVSTVSGSITVDHFGGKAHTGFYKATTGSIKVSLPKYKRVDGKLRSNFGSLNCQIDNYKILDDKKEVVNKQLTFEAFDEYESIYHLEAETKTGSVTVSPSGQE